jgi:manganese/zinc/iron transport system permease protein
MLFSDAFWIIGTGFLVAVTCGLLGCFLLLRKMTMIGDAISHAVLPGIVLAYLVTGSRASLPLLLGAAAFGMLVTVLIELLNKNGKLREDAAIGVSYTWLFAIGVIMVSLFADSVDLDQDCVLYGELAYVPLDTLEIAGIDVGPSAFWLLLINLLVVVAFIAIGYKGLLITSFDPVLAMSLGISVSLWHYLLMGLVSVTTVLSFESVGAILVVAFLVGPPATAFLLTESLTKMLWLTALVSLLATLLGFTIAFVTDGSVAGAMALAIGLLFTLALLKKKLFNTKEPKNTVPANPV